VPDKLITLVVGHTSNASGAQAIAPLSMSEHEYNTDLATLIADKIAKDFNVYVAFRDKMGIDRVYAELEKMNPDANIELHFNSSQDPKAFGTEVLCSYNSKGLAHVVQTKLCEHLSRDDRGNRGVKILQSGERGYASVSRLQCPNVLIEPFFGSNRQDAELGLNKKFKIVDAIHEALLTWFKKEIV
jgi:N-acetylmuramoyl-L-alanine amidase